MTGTGTRADRLTDRNRRLYKAGKCSFCVDRSSAHHRLNSTRESKPKAKR